MRIGVLSALGRIAPEGVVGYGGLERWSKWFADEAARRGNEVFLFGNVDGGSSRFGWTGVHLLTEADVLTREHYTQVQSCDAVLDISHMKFARLARLKNYRAHTFWTDVQAYPGQNIYPSEAVRDAFKDPKAPVIPIGIPVDGSHEDLPPHDAGWVCFGRIAQHKGIDLAVRVAKECGVSPFTVSGHIWPGIDEYFGLAIAKQCRQAGFTYESDVPNGRADELVRRASGLLHLHRWVESFSIVAATGLCHGTPILTTDTGAPQEFVRRFDGGMIVPLKALEEGRPEAAAIARAFFETKWDGRRAGIAKRAREYFDIGRVVDQYLELFESRAPK